MARALRIEFAGALYHVTSRGNRQEDIYESDQDREAFLKVLADSCAQFNWVCHAYCLMTNHYHLMIETPDGNLSNGMRQLNGIYSQTFNRSHQRAGHVFQGRYKAILVEKEDYLLELSRYILLNPVRAQMVRSPIEWPWSSYRAMVNRTAKPEWLSVDWLLSAFAQERSVAVTKFEQFVVAGKGQPSPWCNLRNQVFLGSDAFLDEMQKKVNQLENLEEVPTKQRRAPPKPMTQFDEQATSRDEAISAIYASQHYTLKEIGQFYGLHYSRVSRIVAKGKTRPR